MKKQKLKFVPFKIGIKAKLIFFGLLLGYLFYRLSDYSMIDLGKNHHEMMPTVKGGQTIYLYKRPDGIYKNGDIVYASLSAREDPRLFRVTATSGDNVRIHKGDLLINGNSLKVTGFQLPDQLEKNFGPLVDDELFLIHDNQETPARDSIVAGAFKKAEINVLGKIFFGWGSK